MYLFFFVIGRELTRLVEKQCSQSYPALYLCVFVLFRYAAWNSHFVFQAVIWDHRRPLYAFELTKSIDIILHIIFSIWITNTAITYHCDRHMLLKCYPRKQLGHLHSLALVIAANDNRVLMCRISFLIYYRYKIIR